MKSHYYYYFNLNKKEKKGGTSMFYRFNRVVVKISLNIEEYFPLEKSMYHTMMNSSTLRLRMIIKKLEKDLSFLILCLV